MTDFRISSGGTLAGYSGSNTTVTVPSTVSRVGASAFRNMPVTAVTLPAATTEIHESAFADCTQLASVTIPTTQKIIAANAFTGSQILSQPHSPSVTTTVIPIIEPSGKTTKSVLTQIEWQQPSNAPRTITSYTLTKNGQQSSVSLPITGSEVLTPGQTHTFQISASDNVGEGIRSPLLSYATTGSPWEESGSIASTPAKIATSAKGHLVAIANVSSSDVSLYTLQANGSWSLTETLTGTGTVGSIAMSGDGKTVVVARTADINIHTESAGTWTLLTTLSVQNAQVALSIDGTTLAAGISSGDGTVSLYQKVGSTWTLTKTLYGTMDSSENFGCSLALSADGATLAVGAKYALGKGAVRIFTGWKWRNQANIYGEEASSEQFGYSVALSANGKTVAVGSPCRGTLNSPMEPMSGYGAVTVWTKPTLTWTKTETVYRGTGASDMFGTSVALNGTGTTLVVGSAAAGVSVYAVNGDAWPLVGAFTDAASHVCTGVLGDRIFCGTSSSVKSYTYRTQRLNVAPSVTSLLRAAVVQDAITAEAAAQSLISDMLQYENVMATPLTSDFITQFVTSLPTATDAKKQASLATLLLVGNLISETQNDFKADIADACVQTIGFTADSYIGISAEYINTILQSAEHVGSYTPTTLYVFFPSTTSITMNSSYGNVVYYLEPDVTYTVGATTLNYRRRSELQQILLGLPNSNTFTAPNPGRPIFSADVRRYRLENQYAQPSLLESATYWQQKTLESPATLFNYERMAWISVDMLLSTDTATHEYGRALAAKYIPIARGLKQVAAFCQGGEDDVMDTIPTGYFVGVADGSIAYPESISLTHTTPISRIDAGAFDTAIKQLVFNDQVFTVSGGNITLPYNATRIWSINLNGPVILLPGAPTHAPSNRIIDILANVEYIPSGYFAGATTATHVRFQPSDSNEQMVIGVGAFPASCRLIVSGYNTTEYYYPYSLNGTNTKELTRLSDVFYTNFESNPTVVWYPAPLQTTDYIATLPNNIRSSDILFGVSGMEFILSPELTSDVITWTTRNYPLLFLSNRVLSYGGFIYAGNRRTPVINSLSSTEKLLQLYDQSYTELPANTNGARSSRKSNSIYVNLPDALKTYSSTMIVIPKVTDFTEYVATDSYIGDTLTTRRETPQTPCHYIFTKADLDNGQAFYYGNLGWINSSDASGLRISAVYTTPTTNGVVYLMPGACSLYANMFGPWASSVTSVQVYNPSLRITTSIPAYTFKNCTNLATHGFTFRDSIGASAFEGCSSLTAPLTISSTGGMAIGANAFKGCTAIPFITIDCSGAVSIGANAFAGCTAITSITIDCSGAVSIGANAFAGCTGLTSVTVKGSTVSIDASAFTGCTSVQTITVTNLTTSASSPFPFASMTGLQTVEISLAGAVTLSTMAGLTSLTAVTVTGNSTLTIASDQFSGCSALQTLNVSAPLAGMTTSALSGCTVLQTLALRFVSGATAALNALTGFTSLTSIQVTGGAALTLPSTFCNSLTALTTVSLTSNTLSVPGDGNLFNGASGLHTLTAVVATNPSANTFQVNSTLSGLKTLSLTGAITVAGSAFWTNSVLESLTIRGTRSGTVGTLPSSTIQVINVNHDVSQSITSYKYMNYPVLSSVNITPLLDISDGAFFGCTNLLSFNFDAAKEIGNLAFANTGISGEVVIPESMAALGSSYFVGCPNLKKISYNCNLLMFNDPTTLEITFFNRMTYYNVDANGLGNYYVTGTANLTRGEDLSYNIVYAPSTGGSDVTIDNSSLFRTINWTSYKNRNLQLNELIKVLCTYTDDYRDIYFIKETDASGNILDVDGSGNVTITSNNGTVLYTSGNGCRLAINGAALVVKDGSGNVIHNDGVKHILKMIDSQTERTDPNFATGEKSYKLTSNNSFDLLDYLKYANIYELANIKTGSNGDKFERYKYRIVDNYTEWINEFIYKLQELSYNANENETNPLTELSTIAGWNGTRFTGMDASANVCLNATQLNTYNSRIYPSAVTYISAAILANNDLFAVNQTDPSANFVKPYAIPVSNCVLKLPPNRINHITSESDISMNGMNVDIVWDNASPSIVFSDGTVIDISGSLTRRITENISSEYASMIYWAAQNVESITGDNSVAISISNLLTSIDDMTNKINTTIDISCGLLTIFDSAMTDFDNTTLNIVTPSISIGNGAFTTWTNGSTLNLTTNIEPFVGVDVFKYSDNIIVNSNKFLINTPIVTLVDFSNVTLDDVPALISAHTDVSANNTRNVEIGTYMPSNTNGFARGYTYIKFQEIPTLKQYILLQKPEDWFWAYHDGPWPATTGQGGLKYIECVSGNAIFEQTGLMHTIAPATFSFMGYQFTRNVSFNSSVTQPNTYFRAIKNDGAVQKKALFRNSGAGRLLYEVAPILIAIAVQLLVLGLTFGVGAALAPVATPAIVGAVTAIVGGAAEIGAAFLSQAANTSVETGAFMLGELTPLFWVEIALGALGILGGLFKLLRLLKWVPPGPKPIPLIKSGRWGVGKKFPKKPVPLKPRWGDANKFPGRNPKPANNKIESVVSKATGNGSKFADDAPMFELPPGSMPTPNKPPSKMHKILKIVDKITNSTRKLVDDAPMLVPDTGPTKLPFTPSPPRKPMRCGQAVSDAGNIAKDLNNLSDDILALPQTIVQKISNRVPHPGVKMDDILALQKRLDAATEGTGTFNLLKKQLNNISEIKESIIFVPYRNTDLINAIAAAKNAQLTNMLNHMYFTNNITSASLVYDIINSLKSKYTVYETPANPITLSQYSDYNAQITTPYLAIAGPYGESYIGKTTYTEIEYEKAYTKAINAQYPPYIFPVTGTPILDTRETNSCYQLSTYQTMGTNYEHPYATRIPQGYPCKPARTASPLLLHNNYMWNQLYLGSPRTANNLEYNDLWPGNLWHSYDSVIITATENINTEIYLGNRTVEYTTSILERPNLVYSGATNINILVPPYVTAIPAYAFNSTDGMGGIPPFTVTTALIPSSVTNIGTQAFYRSGLKTLIYPSAASRGSYVFANSPIERVISLSSSDTAITNYRDGDYSVSVVVNNSTKAVTSPGVVALYGFTSAQISRNGVVVDSISNGAGKWLYLQNITSISESGLTINPKQILSYKISTTGLNINGYALYDSSGYMANKTIVQPLLETNITTASPYFTRALWDQTYITGNAKVNQAPFSSYTNFKTTSMTVTFSGVSIIRTGTGTTSTTTPRSRAAPTTIAPYAFFGNEQLTHCDIEPTCTEIGEGAYERCKNLQGVIKLPDGVTKIGAHAFAGTNIGTIVIPPTVQEIGVSAIPATTAIVLVPTEDEKISPGFNIYCIQPEPITNRVYSASSNVLRDLTKMLPSSQLRVDLPPFSPVNVKAAGSDRLITVSWENFTVPYSSGASAHRIECIAENEGPRVFEDSITNPFAISELTNGVEYTISITAINGAGARAPTVVKATPMASAV